MPKDVHQFSCPCCGKQIEIDVRTGQARAQKPAEAKGGKDLEDLLRAQKRDSDRLGKAFDTAKEGQHRQRDQLDDLLKKAKDDASKDPDEKLRRPWDLE